MQFHIQRIPARGSLELEGEFNEFLRSHRAVRVPVWVFFGGLVVLREEDPALAGLAGFDALAGFRGGAMAF